MSDPSCFANRRILVTGATGSIGRATVEKLVLGGAHVVMTGRDLAKLEQLASNLSNAKISIFPYDLTQSDGIPEWMRGMAEKVGPFNGLAHIAGVQVTRALRMMDAPLLASMYAVNSISGIMLAKGLRQKSCHAERSSIVFVGAMAAHIYGAGNVAYAASKGAVHAATRALAHELVRDKIRVNCVTPGLIESDMSEKARRLIPEESWNALINRHPCGIGAVEDVAEAICFLLSDRAKWMTGTEIRVDGGVSVA